VAIPSLVAVLPLWEIRGSLRLHETLGINRFGSGVALELQGIQAGMEACGARATGLRGGGGTTDFTDFTDGEAHAPPGPDYGIPLILSRSRSVLYHFGQY
jgi:hypothetical protein